ncbi:MAG: hemerythrin domain-containing protein [Bacteroidota bacterium]|nr:hemerythrin domain-containing protein [Bacteroidota bacterium]
MKRNKTLIPLSHDHHHGLLLAQMLRKNALEYRTLPNLPDQKAKYAIDFFYSDLIKHFRLEEDILYPFVKGLDRSLDEMFIEIISEHKKIEEYINKLKNNNEIIEIIDIMDTLGKLLESHIRKEEKIVFPKIELVLGEEKLRQLDVEILRKSNH